MHCVVIDTALAASRLGRELLLAGGHRRLAAVEPRGTTTISHALRRVAAQVAREATVDDCAPNDVRAMLDHGVTAIVCDSPHSAQAVRHELDRLGADVPGQVSLAAVGCSTGDENSLPCSGYFVDCRQLAEAAIGLLRDAATMTRPAALWLAGDFIDRGTIAGVDGVPSSSAAPRASHSHARTAGELLVS
jgi:DNA-binding LacI/PurR family transcriptional regulator